MITAGEMRNKVDVMKQKADAMRQEVQRCLGTNYLHIVSASTTISSTVADAHKLRDMIKAIPPACAQLQAATPTLECQNGSAVPAAAAPTSKPELAVASKVKVVVDATERIWMLLEGQQRMDAMCTFLAAQAALAGLSLRPPGSSSADSPAFERFPFLRQQRAALQGLRRTIQRDAHQFLESPRLGASAEDAAAAVAVQHYLEGLPLRQCLDAFLRARSRWVEGMLVGGAPGADTSTGGGELEDVVRAVHETLLHVHSVFSGGSLLEACLARCQSVDDAQGDEARPAGEEGVDPSYTRQECVEWLQTQARRVSSCRGILAAVTSTQELARVQHVITCANAAMATEQGWNDACRDLLGSGTAADLWDVLCQEAVARRTKELLYQAMERILDHAQAATGALVSDSTVASVSVAQDPVTAQAARVADALQLQLHAVVAAARPLLARCGGASISATQAGVATELRQLGGALIVSLASFWREQIATLQRSLDNGSHPRDAVARGMLAIGILCRALVDRSPALLEVLQAGTNVPAAPSVAQSRAAFEAADSKGNGQLGAVSVADVQVCAQKSDLCKLLCCCAPCPLGPLRMLSPCPVALLTLLSHAISHPSAVRMLSVSHHAC